MNLTLVWNRRAARDRGAGPTQFGHSQRAVHLAADEDRNEQRRSVVGYCRTCESLATSKRTRGIATPGSINGLRVVHHPGRWRAPPRGAPRVVLRSVSIGGRDGADRGR